MSSHKDKISPVTSIAYYLILFAGVLLAGLVLYTLLTAQKLNFISTNLKGTALEIKSYVNFAHSNFLKSFEDTSVVYIQNAWQELDIAENRALNLLKEKDESNLLSLPLNDLKLKQMAQELQVLILEFRGESGKLIYKRGSQDPEQLTYWNNIFKSINNKTDDIEAYISQLNISENNIYRILLFFLSAFCVFFSFITTYVYYKYKKQKDTFVRKIEDASTTLEKGLRKTTMAQEALQEAQRQFSTLIQNLPGMVYRCKNDSSWTIEFISDNAFQMTGYRPDDFINNKTISYSDIIHPNDRLKVWNTIQQAIEERHPYQLVYRINTAAGFERWVWEQGVGVFSEQDELVALEGFISDITEQKSVEDQIALQSNALEAAVNGIVIMDHEGKLIWCNSSFTKLTGYTLNDLIGKTLDILKAPDFPSEVYDFMWKTAIGGEFWHGELINKRKDGTTYNEEMTITPVKDSTGQINYFVAIKQDITERKKSEEALRQSELQFRGLYENATIGIYRTSINGKILMANPTIIKMLGYESFDEISKLNAKDSYYKPETREEFKKILLQKGRVVGFESLWKSKDGIPLYMRESARLARDNDGNPLYYEGSIEDITEKKKAEEELITAKERAEQSDKLKSEFLSQMSHEIRTPLNVILSFISMMKDELQDKVDEELKNGFDVITDEGKRIMRTIELIINMSELQTGQYNIRPRRIDLSKDILDKLYFSYKPVAQSKKISFDFKKAAGDTSLNIDEYSVNQIFYHLIDNAIKYTSTGKVEITIDRDPRNCLFVDIIDTGIGISDEYMPMLFTPFSKEEKGYTRNFEGNGLGLALTKKYADLNNAELKVTTQKGKGTTFRVTFLNS